MIAFALACSPIGILLLVMLIGDIWHDIPKKSWDIDSLFGECLSRYARRGGVYLQQFPRILAARVAEIRK